MKPVLGEDDEKDFKSSLNPESLIRLTSCRVEPSLAEAGPGSFFQFERQGYFGLDALDSKEGKLVFNRSVALKDSWAKIEKGGKG
jgi:glutaminyl-tRNA synthetase